jgi:hypothetical protein
VALEFLILCERRSSHQAKWIRSVEKVCSLIVVHVVALQQFVSFLQMNQINRRGRRVALVAAFVTNSSVINIPQYAQCEREMKIPHCNPSVPLLYNGKGT